MIDMSVSAVLPGGHETIEPIVYEVWRKWVAQQRANFSRTTSRNEYLVYRVDIDPWFDTAEIEYDQLAPEQRAWFEKATKTAFDEAVARIEEPPTSATG